jgi:hypothetical protein
MKKHLFSMFAALLALAAVSAFAVEPVIAWNSEDASPVIRVKNTGSENVVMFNNTTGLSYTVTIGDVANTIAFADGDTVAELAASVAACTNASGETPLEVDYNCSLGADSTKLGAAMNNTTNLNTNRKWVAPFVWDTSVALQFSAYIPGKDSSGGVSSKKIIQKIVGDIGGTGDVTLAVYFNGVKTMQKVITSPVYVFGESNSVNVANAVVSLNESLDLPIPRDTDCLIRATRATTATTGGIGAIVDSLK